MDLPCEAPTSCGATTPAAAVLVGRPGGLRNHVAVLEEAGTSVVARLDRPEDLSNIARENRGSQTLRGATVILITEPQLPGFVLQLRRRQRLRVLTESYTSLALAARELGRTSWSSAQRRSSISKTTDDRSKPALRSRQEPRRPRLSPPNEPPSCSRCSGAGPSSFVSAGSSATTTPSLAGWSPWPPRGGVLSRVIRTQRSRALPPPMPRRRSWQPRRHRPVCTT